MRELPRQLTVDELAELFEAERASSSGSPSSRIRSGGARWIARPDPETEVEALAAHPAIGAGKLSARSAASRAPTPTAVLEPSSAYLNQAYEEKFGFRFVVFVNRRPKARSSTSSATRLDARPRGGARHRRSTSWSRSRATAGRAR